MATKTTRAQNLKKAQDFALSIDATTEIGMLEISATQAIRVSIIRSRGRRYTAITPFWRRAMICGNRRLPFGCPQSTRAKSQTIWHALQKRFTKKRNKVAPHAKDRHVGFFFCVQIQMIFLREISPR